MNQYMGYHQKWIYLQKTGGEVKIKLAHVTVCVYVAHWSGCSFAILYFYEVSHKCA